MTDLGGGVVWERDDPREDAGYEPRESGPAPRPDPDAVYCPWCGNSAGHVRVDSPPGIICGGAAGCGNHFTSAEGEWEDMEKRRKLWREETRGSTGEGAAA